MKKNIFITVIAAIGLTIILSIIAINKRTPTIFGSDALYLKKSIDDKIKEAELIVIGEVVTTLPSQWNGPGSNDPKNASPEEISHAHGLFTDSLISINQVLKGEVVKSVVRVRSFSGKTEKVHWENESQPSFIIKRTYLLFLEKDIGATAGVNPGDYVSVNANMAIYEITDGKAISADDEWVLDELIAYIQNSLAQSLAPTSVSTESAITEIPLSTEEPTQTSLPEETITPTP